MKVKDRESLIRWRKRRDFTQRDLAMLCRCSQNTISLLERGGMTTLSDDLALTIAARLQVPWEDLFEVRGASSTPNVTNGGNATGRAAS